MVNMLPVRFDTSITKVLVYSLGKDLSFGIYGFLRYCILNSAKMPFDTGMIRTDIVFYTC